MQSFSFEQLDSLNYNEQKNYLTNYFVPLSNGSHCMLKDGIYEMITDEVLNKVYLKDVVKNLENITPKNTEQFALQFMRLTNLYFMKIKLIFVLNYHRIHHLMTIQKLLKINVKFS